jgi:hypothetical protein
MLASVHAFENAACILRFVGNTRPSRTLTAESSLTSSLRSGSTRLSLCLAFEQRYLRGTKINGRPLYSFSLAEQPVEYNSNSIGCNRDGIALNNF